MIKNYANNLYLLSFIDISDRIDILLLEIRHLQHSIVHSLHAPTLFLPLRHEEDIIFDGWVNQLEENKCEFSAAKLTVEHIIRYPSPRRAIKHLCIQKTCNDNPIKDALLKRVGEIWSGDLWTRGERRHYHALRSLQILKQQVFRNKLMFYREAKKAGLIPTAIESKTTLKKPALMILRRAVIHRLNKYIRILRTHQQQFGKSLDFGLQGYPRPSLERRREIGIFNDFLSNRTRDLQQDMQHLVHTILNEDNETTNDSKITPLVLHGWSQSPKVSNTQLYDNVSLKAGVDKKGKRLSSVQHISYIDTSFWSPDRPDLQPLVAKEIAHSVIRYKMENLSDKYISNQVNDFTTLLVTLFKEINDFTLNVKALQPIRNNLRTLLRELANDFLAASVKGISYLYALFLAIVGEGLDLQLRVGGSLHFNSVHDLSHGVAPYEEQFMWYLRLNLISYWIEKTSHAPLSSIDKVVISGTAQVCDQIIDYLDENVPHTRTAVGTLWKQLAERLKPKIDRSYMTMVVRQWREKRSKDTWNEDASGSGEKEYHRSTIRLDVRLQNYLFRQILHQKSAKEYKPLYGCLSADLKNKFKEVYDLDVKPGRIPYTDNSNLEHPRWLFRHLYDIPFQCAVMRSIDLLGNGKNFKSKTNTWQNFIKQAHQDMSMGRELFAFALEFYTWGRESPKNRLVLCINLIMFIIPELEDKYKEFSDKLIDWIRGNLEFPENSAKLIAKKYAVFTHNNMSKSFSPSKIPEEVSPLVIKLGAIQINAAFSFIKESQANQERRLEQLAGYKLKELLNLYNDVISVAIQSAEKPASDNPLSHLKALGAFLNLRNSSHDKNTVEGLQNPLARERFFKMLLPAFGDQQEILKEGGNPSFTEQLKPPLIKPVMISRISMTNYYAVAKIPMDNKEIFNPQTVDNSNMNGLTLNEALTNDSWLHSSVTDSNDNKNQFSIILGQFDAINIKPTRLPCHCKLPKFSLAINCGENNKGSKDGLDDIECHAKEKFATHFIRRELALPVSLYAGNKSINKKQLIAIISVSLQRRSMRLNLIYRLLNAITSLSNKEKDQQKLPTLEQCLQEMTNEHHDSITINGYLTDGWGDLLIIIEADSSTLITENKKTNYLIDDIFNLQKSLYEDFMVDRTELIYTPACLDYIANSEDYDFAFTMRLLEDRKLENSVGMFLNAFKQKRIKESRWLDKDSTTLVRTPGQMDYLLRFGFKKGKIPKSTYEALLAWMSDTKGTDNQLLTAVGSWYKDGMAMLDKMEVIIEKKN